MGCSSDSDDEGDSVVIESVISDDSVTAFFDAELTEYPQSKSFFYDSIFVYDSVFVGMGIPMENTVHVINSREELVSIYKGNRELPLIDYNKYTLIIGLQRMPCLGFYLVEKKLVKCDDGLHLRIRARNDAEMFPAEIQGLLYWGLYPKLTLPLVSIDVTEERPKAPEYNRKVSWNP